MTMRHNTIMVSKLKVESNRKTKSAKETLEELGEDTDAMLTTQSKLRDTIKEATAVASNNFKGFDILDDNGNYKSTYEIMLGIADIYDEILEADKQFGRNNANLLLESVAGKTRANIAASIFQNPQLLKDAYKSSQEAENSAMEENEKYMDSINGHIAQLQNAYQQLWANSMNRDTVNYFIDLGKSILQVVDNVGLLGTAFIGITSIKSIVGYQSGKGFAYEIIKGSKEAIKHLAANEGAMQSLASKAISTGQAIKGSFSAAIPVIGSVGTAIALVAVAVNAFVEHQRQVRKELLDSTKTTGDEWESRKQSLSDYASQYEELKTKLDSGNLSEQETIDIKQQIYDIQKKIIELNGENVSGIDLINNKLQDQLDIISSISQIEADKIWQSKDYQEGFKIAEQAMTEEGSFAISNFVPNYSTSMQKELSHIIEKYTQHYLVETPELGDIGTTYFVAGDIKDREKRIRTMIKEIEELQKVYSDTRGTINGDEFFEWSGKYLEELGRGLDIIKEAKKEYEQIWLSGLNVQLNKEGNGFVLSNYQKAVSNLEDAYMMNDSKKIKETTYAYEEAVRIKNEFLENPDNTQYLELFDSIDTSLIETKKRYQDTIDLLKDIPTLDNAKTYKKNTKALKKFTDEENKARKAAERLYKLNPDKIDIRNILENDSHAGGELANALKELMDAMNWTTSDADSLIDALVNAGVVHGDVADATNSASDAYNQFSQEIATAIENVSKLNTVLTESVSGAGISTQNIDAFKEMFGDDYVYALERSANGYHINAEKLQTLIDKQNALTNSDYQKTLDAQYDALKRCNDEIIKANNEQKDTSGLLAQRQGILQRIQDTQDLMMAYQASTSAFQTWTNAQSNGNEYDMYDKIANGYDTVKDLIDRGWSGDDTVRSYLDLIYGDSFDAFTASGEECAEMFDNLDKKIEGTSFSIRDFFQFDSSGKITSNGIFNFFDALKEKQDQLGLSDNEKWIKDDGTYDFGFGRDRAAAEQLGIDVEFFQSMLRAAVSAGFELNLDQPMWAMDELEKKAIKAQEELGGFNDIDFEELYNNLDDEDAYETISGHIDDVYDYIQKIEDSDLSPELKTQQIEQAQDMLSYLVALEREAADKGDINLKATVVGSAKEELGKLIEETDELPDALKQYNWDEITDKEGLQKARNYIAAEVEGGRIDSSSAEAFLNILDQALYELNLIDEYEANPTIQGNTVGAFNDVKQAREELEKYIADAQQVEKDYDIKFNFAEDEKVEKLLSIIYGEGTPEILASLGIDSDKTPEEIIEMLESGERDVDVLLNPDSSKLEKSIQNTNGKTVVTNAVNKQTNSVVNETKNLVTEYTEQITNASMDTSDYDEGLEHVEEGSKQANEQKIEPKAGMDTKDFDKKAGNTESKVRALNNLNAVPSVTLGGASQVASAAESMRSQIASIKGKTVSVVANFSHSGLGAVKEAINSVVSKVSEAAAKLRGGLANGTAHVRGTAFARGSVISNHAYASGKWGLPDDQTALTGELGTEIVVRDGNWFTVGDDGAEFVNLKKGDIVFNHKQSRELLENGYVTSNKGRGHLVGFANGTAYSSGNTSGATRARVATSSSKSSSSRSSGGGSRGSGGSGGSGGGNSSSKDAKETKNTLDEVEILIGRIEARISDLDKIIGSTYNTWEDRNDSIIDNLRLVTQEISDQRNAYTTYMNKANSINLSESWKQKIRDGAFRIEDVTDSDLWDKIQEYQTW